MKTYQDLQEITNEEDLLEFLQAAISEYKSSDMYRSALIGDDYSKQKNTTIMQYEKVLYTMSGKAVPDTISANHKLASNFYDTFNVQENQYLLANGVTFEGGDTKDKLGSGIQSLDTQLQKAGKKALTHGVAYGFFNMDHIDVFSALEFVPLYDEEDGSIKAGIRFWQIDAKKPLRMTFFELDGYTEYIKRPKTGKLEILTPKRAYILKVRQSEVDGKEIYDEENYPTFPIVPLWGNQDHVCKINAWRRKIDCYDLIESGFANDVDDASLIYWTITNAGGMDDVDLAEFVQHMKTVHAAAFNDDGAKAESHTQDVPVQARQVYLEMLRKDLIKDAMALDTEAIANGNTVATAIRAAYEPLNNKTDDFEYCVIEFIQGILRLAGIEDDPTFKRSTIINQTEETTMVLAAAQYLDDETILKHLPFLSPDEIEGIMENKMREEAARSQYLTPDDENNNPDGNNPEEGEEEEINE